MVVDYPWFGIGLNNYTQVAHRYASSTSFEANYPIHSTFPLMFAETGIAAGLSFIAFVFLVTKQGIKKVRNAVLSDQPIYAGIFSGFLGFMIAAQFDLPYLWNPILTLFWLMSAILIKNHHGEVDTLIGKGRLKFAA
jgi:O-antigen ligase